MPPVSVFVFATVVVKVPKLPVKVTSSDTAAVRVPVFVMLERFAAAVASSAVTATLPSPLMVLPFTTDAAAVSVFVFATGRCEGTQVTCEGHIIRYRCCLRSTVRDGGEVRCRCRIKCCNRNITITVNGLTIHNRCRSRQRLRIRNSRCEGTSYL